MTVRRRDSRPPDHRQRYQAAPGTGRRRWRRRVHWELVSCGFGGHVLVGTDAVAVSGGDHHLVREADGLRWHRCLRCDTWSALLPPDQPRRDRVPGREEIELPMRGKPLRNRVILRLIALEKSLHVVAFALLATAVFLFTAHRRSVQATLQRVLADLGADTTATHGFWGVVDRLFTIPRYELFGIGGLLAAYAAVLAWEIVGLWRSRRWAEYLAFVETLFLVPLEVRDLLLGVTSLRAATLAVNLAIVVWLGAAHRLFGIRGGASALRRAEEQDSGWPAVERATPPAPVPAGAWDVAAPG